MINSLAVIGNASVNISSLTVLNICLWSNERKGFVVVVVVEFLVVAVVVKLLIGFFDV